MKLYGKMIFVFQDIQYETFNDHPLILAATQIGDKKYLDLCEFNLEDDCLENVRNAMYFLGGSREFDTIKTINGLDFLQLLEENLRIFDYLGRSILNTEFNSIISSCWFSYCPHIEIFKTCKRLNIHVAYKGMIYAGEERNRNNSEFADSTLEEFNRYCPIRRLDINGLLPITTIEPFAENLLELDVSGSELGDHELRHAKNLRVLTATDNSFMYDLSFLTSLQELTAATMKTLCGISNIEGLKLKKLIIFRTSLIRSFESSADTLEDLSIYMSNINDHALRNCHKIKKFHTGYSQITTVEPFASTLIDLTIGQESMLNNYGLANATNVEKLDMSQNISNISLEPFANSLIRLDASGSNMSDARLKCLTRLEQLIARQTLEITTVNRFASTLIELDISQCSVGDAGIAELNNLVILRAARNEHITTVAPFAGTLKILDASYTQISDESLVYAINLEELNASGNPNITTVRPFANSLIKLIANGEECGIDNVGLVGTSKLKELSVSNNSHITTLESLPALTKLDAGVNSGIDDYGLRLLKNLKSLNMCGNTKITTVEPFKNTLDDINIHTLPIGIENCRLLKRVAGLLSISEIRKFKLRFTGDYMPKFV